ncbi:class I SAM-dependent methyltransferase [Microtetraspora malaysiensis]|uniref:class I SAM-dependent methyltransferase n=1 Tax=Microtetraspora malaysiensis TaxID=161358 RepID=UPI003D930FE5
MGRQGRDSRPAVEDLEGGEDLLAWCVAAKKRTTRWRSSSPPVAFPSPAAPFRRIPAAPQRGVAVTATDPDGAMLTELRKHVPSHVRTVQAAFEDLRPSKRYGLVYAAAALHWTNPEDRWSRMASLVEPGGVFASFGGPIELADPAVAQTVRAARSPFLARDDVPSPDGTPSEAEMQWPGTELQRSEWFTEVQQTMIERRFTLTADDYIGHLSAVSAYLVLPDAEREQVFSQIMRVLPETVEINADITVHLARRHREP